MPLYEYKCGNPDCGLEFEKLSKLDEDTAPCEICGKPSKRKMSRFSAVMAGGSPVETVDMSIGREAEKRWKMVEEKQNKRRKGAKPGAVNIPRTQTGDYAPVMALGSSSEKEKRGEFVTALQEHRQERGRKGQGQFDGPGAF